MSTSTPSIYRRIIRRETHSSRSGIAITIAVILILVAAWIGTESVLALLTQPALLVTPAAMLNSALTLATAVPVVLLIIGGIVLAIIGIIIIVVSLKAGRKSRHAAPTDRTAAVVEDRAIASSLARAVSYASDLDPDQVVVTIGKHTAQVRVRPTSGRPVDRAAVQDAVDDELSDYQLSPGLRTRIDIDKKGVVGK
ncbi:hypothetical protein AX769_08295 [Frondihabitans sp. PAMC 28766]|uniref:hypothetical protein n=1 Tax=Frondihabitans sp. PAMC 28766 TaxID=1795630 RepID=UPI00078ECFAC|nr:hypothetical protein [Frondihabitans sp. PAMC 28766]AMM20167.1 hypothetical protein AX769_08295 [Frondihabitans sp. PAMC 28766]